MTGIINQLIGGRNQILLLTNRSGGQLARGDAVILDTNNDNSITTTAIQGSTLVIGAALETIEPLSNGRIAAGGEIQVYIKGSATRGNYVRHSATAKQLEDAGTSLITGVCGILLASGSDQILPVYIFPNFGAIAPIKGVFGITIDGGGSVITTGVKGYVRVPEAGTITKWTLLADQAGAIVIDIWKNTFANYPPTDVDSITGAAPPTLTASDDEAEDSTLTGWTTEIVAGDIFGFNVDSISTITRVTLEVEYIKG